MLLGGVAGEAGSLQREVGETGSSVDVAVVGKDSSPTPAAGVQQLLGQKQVVSDVAGPCPGSVGEGTQGGDQIWREYVGWKAAAPSGKNSASTCVPW